MSDRPNLTASHELLRTVHEVLGRCIVRKQFSVGSIWHGVTDASDELRAALECKLDEIYAPEVPQTPGPIEATEGKDTP